MNNKIFKNILSLALLAMVGGGFLSSCSEDNDPFYTAGPDDFPMILNTDIPEWKNGKPGNLTTINRTEAFTYDVTVTPAQYTTVSWYFDGNMEHEGNHIEKMLLAGIYELKIVATTTKGLETSRTCTVTVLPLDGDPELTTDAKSRWLNPGATASIAGENIDGITGAEINGVVVTNFVNNGSAISFTIPEMAEGNYKLVLVAADGMKYGVGDVKVTNEKWVDPGTVTLWEGNTVINWGESNVVLDVEELGITPGMELTFNYDLVEAEYHCARIATGPGWAGDILPQFDLPGDETGSFSLKVTQEMIDAAKADGGQFLVVGFGYALKSVTTGGAAETVLWNEKPVDINWGDANICILPDVMEAAEVGKTICIYYEVPEAEYHALRICGPWWDGDLVAQCDITEDTPNPFEFKYTADCKAIVDEQGGMLVVGFGYRVTKITVK